MSFFSHIKVILGLATLGAGRAANGINDSLAPVSKAKLEDKPGIVQENPFAFPFEKLPLEEDLDAWERYGEAHTIYANERVVESFAGNRSTSRAEVRKRRKRGVVPKSTRGASWFEGDED